MSVFDNPAFDDHEKVVFCHDAATGLACIIAIHSTALGPGAGGCRLWTYAGEAEALTDVLRLSQGMSYKNAMAELPLGGGKAVIIKHPKFTGSEALYERFGEFVDSLGGAYITAEDMGMSESIMQTIGTRTKYVSGLPTTGGSAGGDPSPKTALGIYAGIRTAVEFKLGRSSLAGIRIAVQGVGNVGYNLCRLLHADGAILVIADIDEERVSRAVTEFGAARADLDEILACDVDVFAPCAMGAVITEASISGLRAAVVAGGANNQLATSADGQRLHDAGILYAPDFVINAGGIINVACEYHGGFTDQDVRQKVLQIGPRLQRIFERSDRDNQPTNQIADAEARRLIGRD